MIQSHSLHISLSSSPYQQNHVCLSIFFSFSLGGIGAYHPIATKAQAQIEVAVEGSMDDAQEEDLDGDGVVDSLDGGGRIFSGEGDQVGIKLVPLCISPSKNPRETSSARIFFFFFFFFGGFR
jgi:hypothetical protein